MKRLISCVVCLCALASSSSATLFLVNENGSQTAPYGTWPTAYTNVQDAINAAQGGDTVLVTNGTYTSTDQYIATITNAIRLESVNGPDVTAIDPQVGTVNTDRHSLRLTPSASNAVVSGFALQGTYHSTAYGDPGVWLEDGTLTNCIIRNNLAGGGYSAGGVRMDDGHIVDCVFSNNTCVEWQLGYGGALELNNGLVERCLFQHNESRSHQGGGAIYMHAGTLRNCVIVENDATYGPYYRDPATYWGEGGGVKMLGGRIENCTIADNTSMDRGAGLHTTGGTVTNCIVYHNTSHEIFSRTEWDVYNSGGTVSYSCTPYVSGTGNTTNLPQFVDRSADDYSLLVGSPCIDSGTALSFSEDKDLNTRPQDGDGYGGAQWDIGAYEEGQLSSQAFSCNFSTPKTETLISLQATFSAHAAGANTNIVYFWWDFNKGGTPAMHVEGPNLWSVATNFDVGYYDVELTVSNSANQVTSLTKTEYIKVYPSVLYVSSAGTHQAPFDTWAKAANDIESAVQEAYPVGGTTEVVIADGTYSMAAQIELEKGIRVRGTNGPSNCTLSVPAQNRSFYIYHPDAVVEGLTLTTSGTGNHQWNGAGAFMLEGTITNCIIRDIVIGGRGAAIWMAGGTVSDCTIVSNRTYEWQYGYGGGIYIENYSWYSSPLVENCEITHNESQSKRGGGGVYMKAGTLRNCLVATNRCTRPNAGSEGIGGGVYMTGGGIVNCTIVDNFSVSSGGGVYIGGVGLITNSIVYFNTVSTAPAGERNLYNSGGTFDHSCIIPAPAGDGNTDGDPEFDDYANQDYHLKAVSPCVDEGTNQAWMIGAVDLDGNDRKRNIIVDMGCYEAPDPSSGPLICGFSATPTVGFTNLQAVFTANPVGLDTNIQHYWWTFGDGNTEDGPDKEVVTNAYSPGYYDVMLVMSNLSGEVATNTKADYIKVAPAVAYVSTSSVPVSPYMTWADAAASVQDALAVVGWSASGEHTVVAVTDATYTVGGQIALGGTNYTIRGVGTAVSNVVLQGSGGSRIFYLTGSGVTLDGLTIKSGYQASHLENGGGIWMSAGLVTNCIISECTAGGRGGGVWMSGGVVSDCTFVTNRSTEWQYGRGGGAYIQGGTIENCVFLRNITTSWYGGGGVYVAGGVVRNCLIADGWCDSYNSVNGDGGGARVIGGVLESCTIVGNRAEDSGGGVARTGGVVTNCIVVNNTVDDLGDGAGEPDIAGVAGVYYSCSPDLTDSVNDCITAAPTFVNAGDGDYRLTSKSEGVNVGITLPWMLVAGARDLSGGPRVLNDNVDMGAYETFVPPEGTIIMLR